MRKGRGDGRHVSLFGVFGCDELEAVLASGLRLGFLRRVELGFPHHIADTVANLEKEFDDIGRERICVESQGTDFGYVSAQRSVYAAAFNTKDNAQIDGDPLGFDAGAAIGTPTIALVVVTDDLEEFGWVFIKAVAVRSGVGWTSADGCPPRDVVRWRSCSCI